jgi:hypothetical protein
MNFLIRQAQMAHPPEAGQALTGHYLVTVMEKLIIVVLEKMSFQCANLPYVKLHCFI